MATGQIRTLSLIAKIHDSLLTQRDAIALTGTDFTSGRPRHDDLPSGRESSEYYLRDGFVVETGTEDTSLQARLSKARDMRERATTYVNQAKQFVALVRGRNDRLIAVSGSTSYQSVSKTDDLDFFCITRTDSLWIFLSRALVLARVSRLLGSTNLRICFSYAVDESFASTEFSHENDALFARDALTTIVLRGHEYYKSLLGQAQWISKYFPNAYSQRTSIPITGDRDFKPQASPTWRKFLNIAIFCIVGRYISIKSRMLNRNFTKQGRLSSTFKARIGTNHCIFESERYSTLRTMYSEFDDKPSSSSRHAINTGNS
jgi:hypothetical protein